MAAPERRTPDLAGVREGGKAVLSRALSLIESRATSADIVALLDEAFDAPRAQVVGITGPPGVGKSTLVNALISHWRGLGRTVGVIAVDPSSRRSGGALLGDRTRMLTDPEDSGVFVRSMAARERLGGLSAHTVAGVVLMRAVFDIVIVETVGVGQSEAEIAVVADTVLFCVQPGSGDSLQFMKAGIMEIPHIAAVTKSDLGAPARRAAADLEGALGLFEREDIEDWRVPVLLVSAEDGDGVEELAGTVDRHTDWLKKNGRLSRRRHNQAKSWLKDAVLARYGMDGIDRAGQALILEEGASPFSREMAIGGQIDAIRREEMSQTGTQSSRN